MEYLATMTTRVPEGVPEETVQAVIRLETDRARALAEVGSLLRLWRPRLRPGEWRTLGLFAADNADHLELLLASMPLRIWRTDRVTPLAPHPNDPAPLESGGLSADSDRVATGQEFLTTFAVNLPRDAGDEVVNSLLAREAQRARDLGRQGKLARLWSLPSEPGASRALGLWRARPVRAGRDPCLPAVGPMDDDTNH